ncbi:MAG: TonB family protein [Labilithrix sp.]|nr:TonB family protein [Labilithrix sp.]MCW5813454.1 TonB family protein [Labilithrix sp.]
MRRALAVAASLCGLAFASVASAQQPAPAPPPSVEIVPPKLVSDPDVDYPAGASGDATVIVVVLVNADGTVGEVKPEDGTPEPFGGAAAEAVKTWTFEPATRGGKPIAARIKMEVAFHAPIVTTTEPEPEEPEEPPKTEAKPGTKGAAPAPKRDEPQEVRVRGAREPGRTVTLTRQEVRQIPGAFGDPFRAVEIMPGVTPIVSGLPFFFIRGAPPGNVGYYLDGVRIPLLFHVGVGPSVVHPGLINRVDLYPGGYPARFGRFSGGIVAGETSPPLDKRHGEFNVRLFDAGGMAETRWGPQDRGSLLLGGRYSYTAFLLTQIASDTLLNYWDYQARATYDLTKDDQVGVFVFGSYDYLGQRTPTQDITLFGTEFHRIDLRYDKKLGDKGNVRMAVTTGFDRSRATEDRFVRDRILGARSEWTYSASPRVLLRAGTDLQMDTYDLQVVAGTLSPSAARVASFFPTRSDLVMGARGDAVIGVTNRLEITPGVRTDLYTSNGATAVGLDPRLAMRTEMTKHVRLLSAFGIAHQAPAFVVPVPGFQPGGLIGGLQKAYQESAGVEADLWADITGTLTVFHNSFADMSDPLGVRPPQLSGCAPGAFPTTTIAGDRGRLGFDQFGGGGGGGGTCGVPRFAPGTIGPDRSGGGGQGADSASAQENANIFEVRTKGTAYGLEVFLKRKLTSRIGGFLSYTLSRSTRSYEGRTYVATFDRTHVLNTALAFDLGKNWRAGTRFTFYTGLPKLPDPTDDSTRLPSFFRADLRLEKRWHWERFWLSFVAEWMNATLTKESIATTCTLGGCVAQEIGPVTIPSLGLEGGF